MKDITRFLGRVSREDDILKHFSSLVNKAKDKFEIREIERKILKPKPIPPYHGPKTGRTDFKQRSLLIVFNNKSFIDRLGKYLKINRYATNNTYHTDMFVELIRLFEDGRIEFSEKDKRFYVIGYRGRRIRL